MRTTTGKREGGTVYRGSSTLFLVNVARRAIGFSAHIKCSITCESYRAAGGLHHKESETSKTTFNTDQPLSKTGLGKTGGKKIGFETGDLNLFKNFKTSQERLKK